MRAIADAPGRAFARPAVAVSSPAALSSARPWPLRIKSARSRSEIHISVHGGLACGQVVAQAGHFGGELEAARPTVLIYNRIALARRFWGRSAACGPRFGATWCSANVNATLSARACVETVLALLMRDELRCA